LWVSAVVLFLQVFVQLRALATSWIFFHTLRNAPETPLAPLPDLTAAAPPAFAQGVKISLENSTEKTESENKKIPPIKNLNIIRRLPGIQNSLKIAQWTTTIFGIWWQIECGIFILCLLFVRNYYEFDLLAVSAAG
jgi:hypothetical protein